MLGRFLNAHAEVCCGLEDTVTRRQSGPFGCCAHAISRDLPLLVPQEPQLGSPVVPFYPFLGEGSPTNIDCRKQGTLVLASLLEDLDKGNSLSANGVKSRAAVWDTQPQKVDALTFGEGTASSRNLGISHVCKQLQIVHHAMAVKPPFLRLKGRSFALTMPGNSRKQQSFFVSWKMPRINGVLCSLGEQVVVDQSSIKGCHELSQPVVSHAMYVCCECKSMQASGLSQWPFLVTRRCWPPFTQSPHTTVRM